MNLTLMQSSLLWVIVILVLFVVGKVVWRKRKLYYYGSIMPGPLSLPFIGNAYVFSGGLDGFYDSLTELFEKQPPIFRFWLGQDLLIVNSEPQDIEILANTFLEKSHLYEYLTDFLGNGLLASPANIWKVHRKMINPTFNIRVLNTFIEIFSKYSNVLVENLKTYSEEENLIPIFWRCTLDIACETLADVDASQLTGQDEYIEGVVQYEHLILFRVVNVQYAPQFIWKRSKYFREMQNIINRTLQFVDKIVATRKLNKMATTGKMENGKRFLNYFLNLKENNGSITDKDVTDETNILLIAASETSAIALSLIFLVLSIHKDVQKKVYEELCSIFGNSDRDATLEDINNMNYLERVIKETLRILPPIPLVVREVDRDVKINSVMYPKGSSLLIPILKLNRDPKFWRDPLKFDPDRFLPEEMEKKHRCTFIPFSYGYRNCIGFKYGMLSIKTVASTLLRHYEISCSKYKSIDEIKMFFHILAKPKDGCHVVLTRRKHENEDCISEHQIN